MEHPDKIHKEVMEIIPWYVNGTLSADERALVEQHVETCSACKMEVTAQKRLAAAIAGRSAFDAMEEENWQRLSDRISNGPDASEEMPIDLAAVRESKFRKFGGYAAIGLIAASALFVFVSLPGTFQTGAKFQTLTEGELLQESYLQIKAADGVDEATMRSLFTQNRLELISGPSAADVYKVVPADGVDIQSVMTILETADEISFVARN